MVFGLETFQRKFPNGFGNIAGPTVLYDPTNGTVSDGDIVVVGPGNVQFNQGPCAGAACPPRHARVHRSPQKAHVLLGRNFPHGLLHMGDQHLAIGVDIGGSHLSACLVDCKSGHVIKGTQRRDRVDAHGDPGSILGEWDAPIRSAMSLAPAGAVRALGVAMPGPFDYARGISLMRGLGKYDALHGMDVRRALRERLGLPAGFPVVFENDAGCFALGEALAIGGGSTRVIGATLGTGFGSGFVAGGHLQKSGPGVPPEGYLYEQPWRGGRAEDAFSGRGVRALHRHRTGADYNSAALLARDAHQDARARATWEEYGAQLGEFLGRSLRGQPRRARRERRVRVESLRVGARARARGRAARVRRASLRRPGGLRHARRRPPCVRGARRPP